MELEPGQYADDDTRKVFRAFVDAQLMDRDAGMYWRSGGPVES